MFASHWAEGLPPPNPLRKVFAAQVEAKINIKYRPKTSRVMFNITYAPNLGLQCGPRTQATYGCIRQESKILACGRFWQVLAVLGPVWGRFWPVLGWFWPGAEDIRTEGRIYTRAHGAAGKPGTRVQLQPAYTLDPGLPGTQLYRGPGCMPALSARAPGPPQRRPDSTGIVGRSQKRSGCGDRLPTLKASRAQC